MLSNNHFNQNQLHGYSEFIDAQCVQFSQKHVYNHTVVLKAKNLDMENNIKRSKSIFKAIMKYIILLDYSASYQKPFCTGITKFQ